MFTREKLAYALFTVLFEEAAIIASLHSFDSSAELVDKKIVRDPVRST